MYLQQIRNATKTLWEKYTMRKQSGQVHSRESSATLQLTVSLLYP